MQDSREMDRPGTEESAVGCTIHNRYRILSKIGEGGFAVTYLAEDLRTQGKCVLKELSWKWVDDLKTIELFEREARVLANLDHPGVPRFIEFFTVRDASETRIYLVQEYIDAENLRDLVQQGKHFTEKETLEIALRASNILEYLHRFSPPIIHRDIKPSNLLISPNGDIHLIDFGAVRDKVLHDQKAEGGQMTIIGTYGYMPFEQYQGRAVPASDIFALGATLIYLLSHKEPHEIDSSGIRLEFENHVRVSDGFKRLLGKMIEPELQNRYASATDLRTDLETLLAGKPFFLPAKPQVRLLLPVAVVLSVAIAAAATLFFFSKPQEQISPVLGTPRKVSLSGSPVRGQILFDGKPITNVTDIVPHFWFRNEEKGTAWGGSAQYSEGEFGIREIPPGRFGMQVNIDANPANPSMYPGDYYAWKSFDVGKNDTQDLVVEMQKIIHLQKPQNNNVQMPGWGKQCESEFNLPRNLLFQWGSLGNGVSYDYSIQKIQCPYTFKETVASGTTQETNLQIQLPVSGDNEFYLLELAARSKGRGIGILMTHGGNGMGWDYRFRVR